MVLAMSSVYHYLVSKAMVWCPPCGTLHTTEPLPSSKFLLRPPLKITLFPVHRPGGLISAEWVILCRFRDFSPLFLSIFLFFYYKTKQKFPASRQVYTKAKEKIVVFRIPSKPRILP